MRFNSPSDSPMSLSASPPPSLSSPPQPTANATMANPATTSHASRSGRILSFLIRFLSRLPALVLDHGDRVLGPPTDCHFPPALLQSLHRRGFEVLAYDLKLSSRLEI